MNRNLSQRKTWLSLALFSGAFLSIYGLVSGFEIGCGFFSCAMSTNGVPVSFYQELLAFVGFAILISSIGLMSIGEAGSGGHFPSRHATLDFTFIIGAFLFAVGLGAFNSFCSEVCWGYWYGFGFPMMLLGIDAMGFALYFLRRNYTIKGQHSLGWELLAIGSLALLLVSTFLAMPSMQPIIPIAQYGEMNFQQFVLIFVSLIGIITGFGAIKNENKQKLVVMLSKT